MVKLSRREALALAAGAAAIAQSRPVIAAGDGKRVAIIGAGAFGTWTAKRFVDAGWSVDIHDAHGAAHARASSGGETRMTRGVYGDAEIYTRMALSSLADWRALSQRAALPIFHPTGVLMFFTEPHPYADASIATHSRLGLPTERLDGAEIARRFPQMAADDIDFGLFEPQFGALLARRSIQTLLGELVAAGARYHHKLAMPPIGDTANLSFVSAADGGRIEADLFIFACGPWLPRLFPQTLGEQMFITRQEVFLFRTPPGDDRFSPARLPGWADFNRGDIYYGFPSIEARGFKIAADRHGPPIDPDSGDRIATAEGLADVRAYMERRFPALAGAPLSEARVCQYENSANGDLLIDYHPQWHNVILAGMGSGHGFKHAPAVGQAVLALAARDRQSEPRLTLATKSTVEERAVH